MFCAEVFVSGYLAWMLIRIVGMRERFRVW
jgi:hypothetical protein